MKNYICKIATIEEMNKKWDYEISVATKKGNWIIWKEQNIKNYKNGKIIPYYGIINDQIICEATAVLTLGVEPDEIRNKGIYKHYGFVEHIKNAKEVYPDGTEIDVEYYGKKLK